ncbi:MAG TPA: hypothetical protein VF527_20305 [Pyrinomonadaceae bacterium]|jgi:hypothetical protein
MGEQRIESKASWAGQVAGGLRHPLTLLIIGSVLSYFLIPYISSISNKRQLLQEARLKKASEIVHTTTMLASQLNIIRSRLGEFHKDNINLRPTPSELKQKQDKLADDIKARYSEFDKVAYWWDKDFYQDAIILEIIPPSGSKQLSDDLQAYNKNLVETGNAIFEFRDACISSDYDFEKEGNVTQIKKQMDGKLEKLYYEREKLVSNLVKDVTAPQQ